MNKFVLQMFLAIFIGFGLGVGLVFGVANVDFVHSIIISVLISIVFVGIFALFFGKNNKRIVVLNDEEAMAFIEVIGGKDNIISAEASVSRVKITLKDVDKIDQSRLVQLNLEGVFLSGNQLQAGYGGNAGSMADMINEMV